jgi:hypothetical protein
MKAYIYCSYKFSPSGFQMGKIEYNSSAVDDYIPSGNALNRLVVTAFEQGIVSKVYGFIPDSSTYIYLVKDMKKCNVIDKNEGEIDIYMNLAFEFDNYDDYKNFSANFNSLSVEQVADECSKFIVPDRAVKTYALKVKSSPFNAFIEKMLKSVSGNTLDEKNICVEVISSKPQENKLKELFHYEFENLGNKTYLHSENEKKKSATPQRGTRTPINQKPSSMNITLLTIVGIVLIVIVVILWKILGE